MLFVIQSGPEKGPWVGHDGSDSQESPKVHFKDQEPVNTVCRLCAGSV